MLIQEVETENLGWDGMPVPEYRNMQALQAAKSQQVAANDH
jgi:hypothetical protein